MGIVEISKEGRVARVPISFIEYVDQDGRYISELDKRIDRYGVNGFTEEDLFLIGPLL